MQIMQWHKNGCHGDGLLFVDKCDCLMLIDCDWFFYRLIDGARSSGYILLSLFYAVRIMVLVDFA